MVRSLPLISLVALLGGCAVGPDYKRPEITAAPDWTQPVNAGEVDLAWWKRFDDPVLTGLVERALAHSPDLAEAQARVAEARANREAVMGGRLPQIAATGVATQNRLSENGQLPVTKIPGFARDFGLFDLGFDASWEIDLWGRRARAQQEARARQEAAQAGRQDAMLILVAEVARTYLDLRHAQADAASAVDVADADAQTARLTKMRFEAGEASRLDAENATGAERASAAAAPEARARATAAAYRLAVLAGAPPEEMTVLLEQPAVLPAGPDEILVGLRSGLLERRPDVRRAERELAGATAGVGVATADLFPRFTLIGGIGQQARAAGDLFDGASTRFQIGPSFSWPVFAGGTIRARLRASNARADAAAARYERAVLGALADSETAINRFLNARTAALDAGEALSHARSAYTLAEQRAQRGEDDRLALMRARKAFAAARNGNENAAYAQAQAAVALFKALGGGWS